MPWLAELVESSEGSLEVLPVQCLCEFLLHDPQESIKDLSDDDLALGRSKFKQVGLFIYLGYIFYKATALAPLENLVAKLVISIVWHSIEVCLWDGSLSGRCVG